MMNKFKKAIEIFDGWALNDKDIGMEENHAFAVEKMLKHITKTKNSPFSFIDAGCGNGWVVRKIKSYHLCEKAIGVDGSKEMILKAKRHDPKGSYIQAELMNWNPESKVDVVHSMEVLYYFTNPQKLIEHIVENWLSNSGMLISGMDYYKENPNSHSWPDDLNTRMTLLSIKDWIKVFKRCGLENIETFQTNSSNDFLGTLIIFGKKSK